MTKYDTKLNPELNLTKDQTKRKNNLMREILLQDISSTNTCLPDKRSTKKLNVLYSDKGTVKIEKTRSKRSLLDRINSMVPDRKDKFKRLRELDQENELGLKNNRFKKGY